MSNKLGQSYVELGANVDLDSILDTGTYIQSSNAEAGLTGPYGAFTAKGYNYPAEYAGILEVTSSTPALPTGVTGFSGFTWQRYTTYGNTNRVFHRARYTTVTIVGGVITDRNDTWSTWKETVDFTSGTRIDAGDIYSNNQKVLVAGDASASAKYIYLDSQVDISTGIPGATSEGALNIEDHLKFFVNTDAPTLPAVPNGENVYGDYDADIWMKDNGYIFAENSIHLRPTNTGTMGSYNERGRVVFKSEEMTGGGINYIQSGNRYDGTVINDLAIGPYSQDGSLDEQYWAYFEQGTGNLGLGFTGSGTAVPDIGYKLHIKDYQSGAPAVMIESGVSNGAKLYLKDSGTTTATNNGLTSNANALTIRAGGVDVASASSTGITVSGSISGNEIYSNGARVLDVRGNHVINGAFDIWQRGVNTLATATSFLTGYTADRWQLWRGGYATGATCSRQTVSGTITGQLYGARVQRTVGNTATGTINFSNGFETVNSIPLAGKQVTISAWIKMGADFSGSQLLMRVVTGTGTDQRIPSTYTGSSTIISGSVSPNATYARYSYTATVSTTATQVGVYFQYTPTGTAGADDWFEVAGVQLEIGPVATDFQRRGATINDELQNCMRYYQRFTGTAANLIGSGSGSGGTTTNFVLNTTVPFRIAPSSVGYTGVSIVDGAGGTTAITGLGLYSATTTNVGIQTTQAINSTAYRPYFLRTTLSSDYLELNAEI